MGTIGLVALSADGRHRAVRGLGSAVLVLVLLDPALAVSAGFALSALATAGILLLAPGLARRAGAVAAALAGGGGRRPGGGPARLHAAGRGDLRPGEPGRGRGQPPRRPGGRAGHRARPRRRGADPGLGAARTAAAAPAPAWCVAWLVAVAEHGAALPTAAVGWGTGPAALVLLAALTALVACGRPAAAAPTGHRGSAPRWCWWSRCWSGRRRSGWPPEGWVLVACDVGQGDALVLQRRARAGAWWSTPAPTRTRSTAAWTGSASRRCRCWCSPTSTPTTSTGSTAWSPAAGSAPSRPPGCSTRRAGWPRSTRRPRTPDGGRPGDVRRDPWPSGR